MIAAVCNYRKRRLVKKILVCEMDGLATALSLIKI